MNKKKPYYIAIDVYDLRKTEILPSITELSALTGVHRNTLRLKPEGIWGHYLIIPYKLK
jgi:hypothetical protein